MQAIALGLSDGLVDDFFFDLCGEGPTGDPFGEICEVEGVDLRPFNPFHAPYLLLFVVVVEHGHEVS